MPQDALELFAVHLLEQARGHGHGCVLGVSAGRKRVGRRIVDDVDAWHRHAGGNGHLADHVVQLGRLLVRDLARMRAGKYELVAAVVREQAADAADADGNEQRANPEGDFVAAPVADAEADDEPEDGEKRNDDDQEKDGIAAVSRFLGVESCHSPQTSGSGPLGQIPERPRLLTTSPG